MKNIITIPVQVHELKEKDLVAAAEHRKNYSLKRDLQAEAFNKSIAFRLAKEKESENEKQAYSLVEEVKQVKCEKCGKVFSSATAKDGIISCPECNQVTEIE